MKFQKILPIFAVKRVLDLGCGFGWHCQYAIEHGAITVTGVDILQKMLEQAKVLTNSKIQYLCEPLKMSNLQIIILILYLVP